MKHGATKELASEQDARRAVATQIGLEVGLLEKCTEHGCVYDAMNDFALEDAFRCGESLILQSDPLVAVFGGSRISCTMQSRSAARACPIAAQIVTTPSTKLIQQSAIPSDRKTEKSFLGGSKKSARGWKGSSTAFPTAGFILFPFPRNGMHSVLPEKHST